MVVVKKKIVVFTLVMIFSLHYGSKQVESSVDVVKLDTADSTINITVVSSLIAFARIISQVAVIDR